MQWGFGAVGNALWRGVRLKDVLSRANVRPETVEIVLNGADGPVLDGTPDFIKSIPVDKALDDNTLIAYEMNGAPFPHYNGFPIRLVVPGWTATYWMKHLDTIEAVTKPFAGFWMKSAYRIPNGKFPIVQHFLSQMAAANEPITEMVINSMITAPAEAIRCGRRRPPTFAASPGTAATASAAWKSRPTAATRGAKPSWARTSAALRFAFPFPFTPPRPGRIR